MKKLGTMSLRFLSFVLILISAPLYAQNSKLSDSIPYPFYDVQKASEGMTNKLKVINSGLASFEQRLELIRSAQDSIELEYFIYEKDLSGRLLTQELVKAGDRGVKIRMLIDKSKPIFALNDVFADELSHHNIDLRFYNAAPLIRLSTVQFRNHRKIMIADDKKAIIGGRNIGDDYFDLSPHYNFLDRDVYLEGPMALTIRKSFDEYFASDIVEDPKAPSSEEKEYATLKSEAASFIKRSESDAQHLKNISVLGKKLLAKTSLKVCPELTWSTDRPGGSFWTRLVDPYSDDYRYLRKTIYDKMIETDKKVVVSSPYLMNNKYSRDLMYDLLDQGVKIETYTNSLSSTDAVYVAANLYKDVYRWRRKGIVTNLHRGSYIDEGEVISDEIKNARWGTHSKTYLFESQKGNEFLVGTYNVDNRSNHYNTELGLFCSGNESLYRDVADNVYSRIKKGMEIKLKRTAISNETGKEVNRFGDHPEGLTTMRLISLPSWLLKFLL